MNYTATKLAQKYIDLAIEEAEYTLYKLGGLVHPDVNITQYAKNYFSQQYSEVGKAIEQLKELRP